MFMLCRGIAVFTVLALMGLPSGCIPGTGDDDADELCGNGIKDPGEQCDDGNLVDHDGCSAKCQVEGFCGNGVLEPGEECDDGNYTPGDGCGADCDVEVGCGNGILEVGEECDDDNVRDMDGCSAVCQDEEPGFVCGNGIFEIGEGCDDGNNEAGDGCDANCMREDGCGNGVLEGNELCDDGNNISGDGCSGGCLVEFVCGNHYCEEENYETCEACPVDCCPDCGDGILGEGEGCDDGNNTSGDGCSRGCTDEDGVATCGNSIWEAGEECEDGNTEIHDGCSDTCESEFECGDQECWDHVGENCQRCPMDCCPNCGNGVLEPLDGEECDQTDFGGLTCQDWCYPGGTPTCTAWCTLDLSTCTGSLPVCGNATAECGEQCDGADLGGKDCSAIGYDGGTLACDSSCRFDTTNCGALLWYLWSDFEDPVAAQSWTYAGDWEWGQPTSGPGAAYSGNYCIATVLGGNYSNSCSWGGCSATSPPIDLSVATSPALRFQGYISTEGYVWDGCNVKVSTDGGASFTVITGVTPAYNLSSVDSQPAWGEDYEAFSTAWTVFNVDLAPYAGQTIHLRFDFRSDSSVNYYPGCYVDDVLVAEPGSMP